MRKQIFAFLGRHKQNAFSLVELMVVVALIGILASIGIPQYSKFQAKSRQIEAKSSLSALFAAEVGFFSEWNQYTVNILNAGFGVRGVNLKYSTGFWGRGTGYPCTNYVPSPAPDENVVWGDYAFSWSCSDVANIGSPGNSFRLAAQWSTANGFCRTQPSGLPPGTSTDCNSTPGSQSFRAAAVGDPNANILGTSSVDAWTIDQTKKLSNSTPGIQ